MKLIFWNIWGSSLRYDDNWLYKVLLKLCRKTAPEDAQQMPIGNEAKIIVVLPTYYLGFAGILSKWLLKLTPYLSPIFHLSFITPSQVKWVNLLLSGTSHMVISALLAICAGNSPVPGEFPTQRPVTRSLDLFFDLRLNKRLSKLWWSWWSWTPSCPLWRHCNVNDEASFCVACNGPERMIKAYGSCPTS